MRFREADGRKVVSAESAESIGRIEAYVIDTGARSVSAFRLAKVKGDATFVSWEDVQFGPDAVVVPSSDRLRTARDEAEARAASKDLQPVGKLVLDKSGTALGKVGDVEFDPGTGAIVEFHLGDRGTVTADRLLGLGAYAVVVAEAP